MVIAASSWLLGLRALVFDVVIDIVFVVIVSVEGRVVILLVAVRHSIPLIVRPVGNTLLAAFRGPGLATVTHISQWLFWLRSVLWLPVDIHPERGSKMTTKSCNAVLSGFALIRHPIFPMAWRARV